MNDKSIESELENKNRNSVPILASGIGTRISALASKLGTRKNAASVMGVSSDTLQRYISEGVKPSFEPLAALCQAADASLEWLATGKEKDATGSVSHQVNESTSSCDVEGFSLIPLYDVSASAGHGADIGQERIASQIAFRQDWLRREGLAVQGLAVITAQGDSMEPAIADGALLLVDSNQRKITNDSIYILRWDGCLYAKRLQLMFSQSVRIISDNKAYTEEQITPEEAAELDIVGRVVWVGQKI